MWLIAEVNRDTKRKRDPYRPRDFMPASMVPEEKPLTPEQIYRMLNAAFVSGKEN